MKRISQTLKIVLFGFLAAHTAQTAKASIHHCPRPDQIKALTPQAEQSPYAASELIDGLAFLPYMHVNGGKIRPSAVPSLKLARIVFVRDQNNLIHCHYTGEDGASAILEAHAESGKTCTLSDSTEQLAAKGPILSMNPQAFVTCTEGKEEKE